MRGLFREPVGVDFSVALARGLRARLSGEPPEAIARVTILVNTSRMARRFEAALAEGGATLLPRIGLVSDVAPLLPPGEAPVADVSTLAMRLRLTRLVAALLSARPDLSPPSAAFDLAGSLQRLLGEMQEEGLHADALGAVETGDLSEHWQRTLDFTGIAADWLDGTGALTPFAAQARALDRLIAHWAEAPPADPVIVAGSTASRTPTRRLVEAVMTLPQGVVVLPGVDGDMPEAAWRSLTPETGVGQQDHPQYRHAALLKRFGLTRADAARWHDERPAAPARNRLISLALRPAPATDAWRGEGPALRDIAGACAGATLLAAPSPGAEAAAIATGLCAALHDGRRAALITPDRGLSRQVAAHLDRWGILPDDSAGRPLSQSSPGRLLLHVSAMRGQPVEAEALAVLLKHPLTHSGGDRRAHLSRSRRLETMLLRRTPLPFPTRADVDAWAVARGERDAWTGWLGGALDALAAQPAEASLARHAETHRALVERLAQGNGPDIGPLWRDPAGRAALRVLTDLAAAAPERGEGKISAHDFDRILHALLAAEEVRDTFSPHPDVMIWGALEARVRTADLVILGGLNDEIWPGQPEPDPWLNRTMRAAVGLPLPERQIGLSAHDFQQAAAGPEVWLSRAIRTAEADTVPSRWLNRIEGLLGGIGAQGEAALADMRARGERWLRTAATLEEPRNRRPPAPRPAPRLPGGVALRRISVTAVETLIRDPYAIYARDILRLSALDPLRQGPDARLRGSAVHTAMERFARAFPGPLPGDAGDRLRAELERALAETAPWPGPRRIWLGKFDRVIPDLIASETARRAVGAPLLIEGKGALDFTDPPFTLTAKADRMDARGDRSVAIYDYKTGPPPTARQQGQYAKQLLLEALMVADGAFAEVAQRQVDAVAYLQVGSKYAEVAPTDFGPEAINRARDELGKLMHAYATGRPFIARLAPDLLSYASDYDQLSRFGEWDDTTAATVLPVGRP